jgi:hypothetical protein
MVKCYRTEDYLQDMHKSLDTDVIYPWPERAKDKLNSIPVDPEMVTNIGRQLNTPRWLSS